MKTSKIISLAAAFGLSVLSSAAFAAPVTTPDPADQATVDAAYNSAVSICAGVEAGTATLEACEAALATYIEVASAYVGGNALAVSVAAIATDIGATGEVLASIETAEAVAEATASVTTTTTTTTDGETTFGGSDGPAIIDEDFGGGDGGEPTSES